jgi:hypothetical protein
MLIFPKIIGEMFVYIIRIDYFYFIIKTGKPTNHKPQTMNNFKEETFQENDKDSNLEPFEMINYLKENKINSVYLFIAEFGHYVEVDRDDFLFNIFNSNFTNKYEYIRSTWGNNIRIKISK